MYHLTILEFKITLATANFFLYPENTYNYKIFFNQLVFNISFSFLHLILFFSPDLLHILYCLTLAAKSLTHVAIF